MPILPLRIIPDPILRQPAAEVAMAQVPKLKPLVVSMVQTMDANKGVGLAAPQVGECLRLIVVSTIDGPLALFNPVLSHYSLRTELGEEGCLSIPGVFGRVRRHIRVQVDALGPDGHGVRFTAKGFFARVIQHEVDHLNGVLFIDHAKAITTGADRLKELLAGKQPVDAAQ